MTDTDEALSPEGFGNLAHLTEALDGDQFRYFLDHVAYAVAVSELGGTCETLIYVNIEFERLTGLPATGRGKALTDIVLNCSVSLVFPKTEAAQ